jgi:hypothetical protein
MFDETGKNPQIHRPERDTESGFWVRQANASRPSWDFKRISARPCDFGQRSMPQFSAVLRRWRRFLCLCTELQA